MKTRNSYLSVENISFSYDETEKVLFNVSFEINKDDTLVILGASGDGKTTLLRIISGALVEDEGDVYINGVSQKTIVAHKRNIAYLFQQVNLYNHLSIYENLMIGFKKQKLSFEEKDRQIKMMLQRLRLVKFVNLKPKFLSLGQQQKIAIAKALLSNADLYLFDEPFSALDPQSRQQFLEILKEEKQNCNAPFIYVTHDQEDAYKIATKILILKEGKVLQFGTLEEVLNNPKHADVFSFIGERMNKLFAIKENNIVKFNNININTSLISDYNGDVILTLPISSFCVVKKPTSTSLTGKFIKSSIDKNGNNFLFVNFNEMELEIPYHTLPLFDANEEVFFEIDIDQFFIFNQTTKNRIY